MLPDFRGRQRDYLLEISRALTEELDLATVLERDEEAVIKDGKIVKDGRQVQVYNAQL